MKNLRRKLNCLTFAPILTVFASSFTTSCQYIHERQKFLVSVDDKQKIQFSNPTIGDSHIVHYVILLEGNFKIGDEVLVILENQTVPEKTGIFVELTPQSLLFNVNNNTTEIEVGVQKAQGIQDIIFSAKFSLRFTLRRDGRNIDSKTIDDFIFHNATPIPEEYLWIDKSNENETILRGIARKKEAFDSLKFCNVLLVPEDVNIIAESAFFSEHESIFPQDYKWEIWFSKNGQFLTTKDHENLIKIEKDAFRSWVSLSGNLILPSTVKEIADFSFQNIGISSLVLPNDLQQLGDGVFRGATVNHIKAFPEGLTRIPDGTFQGCTNLQYLPLFPAQCTDIANKAFSGCTLLEQVNITNAITKIGDEAFSYCSNLETINFVDFIDVPNFEGHDIFAHPANVGTVRIHPKVTSDLLQKWRDYILSEEQINPEWLTKWRFVTN